MKAHRNLILGMVLLQIFSYQAKAVDQKSVCEFLQSHGMAAPSYCGSTAQSSVTTTPTVTSQPVTQVPPPIDQPTPAVHPASPQVNGNSLDYKTVVDIGANKGVTFFTLMKRKIDPALDRFAKEGFEVVNGQEVEEKLSKVDSKVARKAIQGAGGKENLKTIADQLNKQGKMTFYSMPEKIQSAASNLGTSVDSFGLTTFYALVSGGGVAVKVNGQNISYNVNYGAGDQPKDEMTGRSFGEAPGRLALDASDAHYLTTLEHYVRSGDKGLANFYASILEILVNNDPTKFSEISPEGQAVASDFVAVYVAEQDRHLMANLETHHWDRALLEVTLISALHSGQDQVKVMYRGTLTAQTNKQQNGCSSEQAESQKASMMDYWQFSQSTDPENCRRSGINVTRDDFRKLGQLISRFEQNKNPQMIQKIYKNLDGIQKSGNLLADLSAFLINYKTPESLGLAGAELVKNYTEFLMQVKKDANEITSAIEAQQ